MLDTLCLDGLGEDTAHHECSESRTVTHTCRDDHHQEAESYTYHHQGLCIDVSACLAQKDRHQIYTHQKP